MVRQYATVAICRVVLLPVPGGSRLTYAAAGYKQLLQLYVDITVDITVDTVDISTRRRPGSGNLEIIA